MLPLPQIPPDVLRRAQNIRVLFLDVDGVLTDGGLHFSAEGETSKRFNTLDGHGLKLLQKAGITPAVVTGRDSPALRTRLKALGIDQARFGTEDKHPAAQEILNALGLGWHQAAAMGDDWPDLPMMLRCAFAAAPPNAHPEVSERAHYTTRSAGGQGAVREVCDVLMTANGHYPRLLQTYLC
jgi:3-deoxy-D-manno-octulosonate 8-phosphate phosphatase (KDO 8-P phosphatase)